MNYTRFWFSGLEDVRVSRWTATANRLGPAILEFGRTMAILVGLERLTKVHQLFLYDAAIRCVFFRVPPSFGIQLSQTNLQSLLMHVVIRSMLFLKTCFGLECLKSSMKWYCIRESDFSWPIDGLPVMMSFGVLRAKRDRKEPLQRTDGSGGGFVPLPSVVDQWQPSK